MRDHLNKMEHRQRAQRPRHQNEPNHKSHQPAQHHGQRHPQQQRRHAGGRHLRQPRPRRGSEEADEEGAEVAEQAMLVDALAHLVNHRRAPKKVIGYGEASQGEEAIYIIKDRIGEGSKNR